MPSPFDAEQQRRFDEGFEKAVAKYPPDAGGRRFWRCSTWRRTSWAGSRSRRWPTSGSARRPAGARPRGGDLLHDYRLHPVGRHHIGVCNSVSCWAMGSESILRHCEERLGIRPGQVTKDGQFSLEEVACLASCGTAPAALHNIHLRRERHARIGRRPDRPAAHRAGQTMAPGPIRVTRDKHAIEKQSQPQATAPWDRPRRPPSPPTRGERGERVKILSATGQARELVARHLQGLRRLAGAPQGAQMQPQQIVDQVVKSNLRGRGGAGFPTG